MGRLVTVAGEVLAELRSHADAANVAGMARFGIRPRTEVLGGPNLPGLRRMGKRIGPDQPLAEDLWRSGVHEARMLAVMVADPATFTRERAEGWVADLDAWDLCDAFCATLVARTPYAHEAALEWALREEEFVKRAGFALMAALAVHDRQAPDAAFVAFLPSIEREATDRRNFVRKAVNWGLRQIGKRNRALNEEAIACAERILEAHPRSGRWVANDALRELRSRPVQQRLEDQRTAGPRSPRR
jgi:3-methyladenine DNA glycosylase AlkD